MQRMKIHPFDFNFNLATAYSHYWWKYMQNLYIYWQRRRRKKICWNNMLNEQIYTNAAHFYLSLKSHNESTATTKKAAVSTALDSRSRHIHTQQPRTNVITMFNVRTCAQRHQTLWYGLRWSNLMHSQRCALLCFKIVACVVKCHSRNVRCLVFQQSWHSFCVETLHSHDTHTLCAHTHKFDWVSICWSLAMMQQTYDITVSYSSISIQFDGTVHNLSNSTLNKFHFYIVLMC